MNKKRLLNMHATLATLAIYAVLAAGSGPSGSTVDQIDIVRYEADDHIYKTDGEADYGKKVKVFLKNRGRTARITVDVVLSSSQGRWKKRASTSLESNETGPVYLDFPEPDFGASDIMISKVEVVSADPE
ncbi:MAG: hypothetical protein SFV51_25245 [Bryobacteraceae bacterium]|nr:hypothetical protein [Bryobacteraceae bacterium]